MNDRLVWIDCEMTGLDLVADALIEVAVLVTDYELNVLGEGIDLALANKESLVVGGELVMQLAEATGAQVIPVDSEHSALYIKAFGKEGLQ